MSDHTRQSVLFPDLLDKPLHVAFDAPLVTSDGGAILIKRVDDAVGLTEGLAARLAERRQLGKIRHTLFDLVRQRVFGLARTLRSRCSRSSAASNPQSSGKITT